MDKEQINMNSIKVEDATSDDVEEIEQVRRMTWLNTYPNQGYGITREDIEAKLNDPEFRQRIERRKPTINTENTSHTFVVKDNGKVVGFSSPYIDSEHNINRFGSIYVLPDYQKKGIGGKLMEAVLNWYGPDKNIHLHVVPYNTNAIKFYQKYGFELTGKTVTDEVAKLPSGAVIPEVEMIRNKQS